MVVELVQCTMRKEPKSAPVTTSFAFCCKDRSLELMELITLWVPPQGFTLAKQDTMRKTLTK